MRIKVKKVKSAKFGLDFFIIKLNIEGSVRLIRKSNVSLKKQDSLIKKTNKEQYEQQNSTTSGSISQCPA